jgi:polysaccharide pyruvyl transferase WcaK-like protein
MKKITSEDVYLSTGGDMMCYDDNNQVTYTNNFLHKKGVKTILWGCSMGKENLTPSKLDTLKNFSAIYVRESLSYDFFKELGLKKIVLLPDPAFILKPQHCELPAVFVENEVVGINLSKFVLSDNSIESDKAEQVLELLNYIVKKTKYHILLIPHVFWNGQNDKIVCEKFKALFETNSRVSLLDSEKLNYCEIRYAISKCKFFIGARTHSVISAYSMCVPTIALGYSIKSRGIAKDIGLPENLVVDFRDCLDKSVLLNAFLYMQNNEAQIRSLLHANVPPYVKKLEDFDFNTWIGEL